MEVQSVNTILYCRRFDECLAFYSDVLGLPIAMRNEWFVEFHVGGEGRVSIANERRASIKSSSGVGITLTFRVDDADAVHDELVRRGASATAPRTHPWGARTFYVFDPEGCRIEFWSPLAA